MCFFDQSYLEKAEVKFNSCEDEEQLKTAASIQWLDSHIELNNEIGFVVFL